MAKSILTGDWKRAGLMLQWLPASLSPIAHAQLYSDGELVVKRMVKHINDQSLPWKPLHEYTIKRKGHSKIYVESQFLRDNLDVRRMKTSPSKSTIFVGASPWKTHTPSGLKFSDLMIMMEYGTSRMPARPLIRPTWEEMESEIKKNWSETLQTLLKGGML